MTILPNPFTDSALEAAMPAEFGRCPGLTDPPVAAVDDFPRGFDVGAFMAAIEPAAGYA